MGSSIKIALLADGGHVNCERWCEGLYGAGAEVHLISYRPCAIPGIVSYQLPVSYLPAKLCYFSAVPCVRRLLRRIKPDVLLAYYVTGYGTLAALSRFHPVVQITSGSDILKAPQNPALNALLRYTLPRADLVTAWAPHMAEAALKLRVSPCRVMVMPRGIPYDTFAKRRALRPHAGDAIKIISTRSLKSDYKINLLVAAVSWLQSNGVSCSATLAGDGPDRTALRSLAESLRITDSVTFSGFVSNNDLPDLLARHNIYVSLIDSDGVSASLLEAMTIGMVPIVPDNAANRFWIRDGENGILLHSLSPQNVAEAIRRTSTDIELRHRAWRDNPILVRERGDLRINAKLFVERFRRLADQMKKDGTERTRATQNVFKKTGEGSGPKPPDISPDVVKY